MKTVRLNNGVETDWYSEGIFILPPSPSPHDQNSHHPLPAPYLCHLYITMAISLSWPLVLYPVVVHFPYSWTSQHIHTPRTHTLTPPPCRQAIYREVITPVNDGNAELEPINAASMTNSTPTLHTLTHTHTHRSVRIYVSSGGGLQRQRECVCVLYACCHDQFLLERWKADFLGHLMSLLMLYCIHARLCAASVARCVGAMYVSSLWAYWCFFW